MFEKLKQFLEEFSTELFVHNQLIEEDSEWEDELVESGQDEEYILDPGYNGRSNTQEIRE